MSSKFFPKSARGLVSYLSKRLVGLLVVILAVTVFAFMIVNMTGDPARSIAGYEATAQDLELVRIKYGLDKPLPVRYFIWLSQIIQGDFGKSVLSRAPVLSEIIPRLVNTLELAILSNIISICVGIFLGIIAAVKGGLTDSLARFFSVLGVSVPVFISGLLLIYFFAVGLRILPTSGKETLAGYILPAFTLAMYQSAFITRVTRAQMRDVLDSEYVKNARAIGLSDRMIIYKYSLRNALVPIVTVIGLQVGYALGGSVITESIFRWPGIGTLLVNSILTKDYPVIQAALLFYAVTIALLNMIVDLVYAAIDPRIRK